MKSKRFLYGIMGIISILGFIGVFTEERVFLSFFAFAVNFEYFFIKPDEMLDEYMNKSASRGFYCGMLTTVVVTLVAFFIIGQGGYKAFITGLALGWAASVIAYSFSTAYHGFREKWGLADDKN